MISWLSIGVSLVALAISGLTAWLTFFRKGRLMMTQPTQFYLGPDGEFNEGKVKIFITTLLYSSAYRGHVVESLYVTVQRGETKQNFNIWVYGQKGALRRGSGLFVPRDGVVCDHHFLLPEDTPTFELRAGTYRVTVIATIVGAKPKQLATTVLAISESQATALLQPRTGIYFDWGPDLRDYHPRLVSNRRDR